MGLRVRFTPDTEFFRLGNVPASLSTRRTVLRIKRGLREHDLPLDWIKKRVNKPPQIALINPVKFCFVKDTNTMHFATRKQTCILEASFIVQITDEATGKVLWPEKTDPSKSGRGFKFFGF